MAIHLIIFDNYLKFIYEHSYARFPTKLAHLHEQMYGDDVYIETFPLRAYFPLEELEKYVGTIRRIFDLHSSDVTFIDYEDIDLYRTSLQQMLPMIVPLYHYRQLCHYRTFPSSVALTDTEKNNLPPDTTCPRLPPSQKKTFIPFHPLMPIPTHPPKPVVELRNPPTYQHEESPFDITDKLQYEDDQQVHPFYHEIQGDFAPLVPMTTHLYDAYVANLVIPETIYYLYYDKLNLQCRLSTELTNHQFANTPYFPELEFVTDVYEHSIHQGYPTFQEFIHSRFIGKFFESKNDVKKLVEALLYTEQIRSKVYETETKEVHNMSEFTSEVFKHFIQLNFDLSTTDEHKIKSSHLMSMLKTHLDVYKIKYEPGKLSSMMPIVLQELGIKKKRYKDGNYWYGLEKRSVENEFSERINTQLALSNCLQHKTLRL